MALNAEVYEFVTVLVGQTSQSGLPTRSRSQFPVFGTEKNSQEMRGWLVLLVLLGSVLGDELYLEGFYNLDQRAGSDTDPRGIPTLPYVVDTNRYSDGIVSRVGINPTSPHFPDYQGALSNISDRYAYYRAYKENAAEQGIAVFGEGEARQEDAAFKILSIPNYESLPEPTKSFFVYAAIKWNPTGFAIQEGEYYNITVFGSDKGFSDQFWNDGGLRVNADGYTSYYDAISNCFVAFGRCRGYLKRKRRIPDANWMSLSCGIGQFVRPLGELEEGQEENMVYMPLDEAQLQPTIFSVGRTVYFRASYTGELICFANDANSNYWNNGGYLTVSATRKSWPPDPVKNNYFQPKYLPACDSAIAVYANGGDNVNMPGMKCNPDGGGSGWKISDVLSDSARYGSGIPDSVLNDRSNSNRFET